MKQLRIERCMQCRWLIYDMGHPMKLAGVECGRTGRSIDAKDITAFPELCPLPDRADTEVLGEAIQVILNDGDINSGLKAIMEMAWGEKKASEIINAIAGGSGG